MSPLTIGSHPDELNPGLAALCAVFPDRLQQAEAGQGRIEYRRDAELASGGVAVSFEGDSATVAYNGLSGAFRGTGRIFGMVHAGEPESFSEAPAFDTNGFMLDCSRNGVPTVDMLQTLLAHSALMGVNMMMLYTEDTYEVPGEPFFGYLRGRYTQKELKAIDDIAFGLGIEVIPCIQTLGHLAQILQWPAYADLRDNDSVLMAGREETYELIEKMIDAVTEPLRSNRIHLGMDEAHGIGKGRYREVFGDREPFEIMNEHLDRVGDICRKRNLKPMIWSDMYFRLGSETNDYYDREWSIPQSIIDDIPKDIQLVYWDYYHTEKEHYKTFIDFHRKLGSDPVVAGGIWTWMQFWANYPFTCGTMDACIPAAREKGVREVFMTMWGDDGAYCDFMSVLPGLQRLAEHNYAGVPDERQIRRNLQGAGIRYVDWMRATEIDNTPRIPNRREKWSNPSSTLIWSDPVYPVHDHYFLYEGIRTTYAQLADALEAASAEGGINAHLALPAAIARVISIKSELRGNLEQAYRSQGKDALSQLLKSEVIPLRAAFENLWEIHRDTWMANNKPFGWDTIDKRYGGQIARVKTLTYRIEQYLTGEIDALPELEADILDLYPNQETGAIPAANYARASTASVVR